MEKIDKGDPSGRTSAPTSVSTRTHLPEKDGTLKQAANKDKMNPLNIPEIVAVVVGHLNDVGDLKSVRTQSTVWRDETLQKWRDSAVLLITVETFPILVKAFEEADLAHFCEGGNDPFKLKKVPFKKYRFAGNRGDQLWTYPLSETDWEGRLLWDKVISPHATYLDVGPFSLKKFTGGGSAVTYQPALRWIIKRCLNVTDLAMAPLLSVERVDTLSDSEEEDDEGNQKELTTREYYWYRPGGLYWKLKRITAHKVTSLTLSSPPQASRSSDGNRVLNGLSEYFHHDRFVKFLMGVMKNIKHLQLPNLGEASELFRHTGKFRLETLTAFASEPKYCLKPSLISVFAPERELRMTVSVSAGHRNDLSSSLRYIICQKTFQKLEFEIIVSPGKESTLPSSSQEIPEVNFSLDRSLENLTHLKITMEYDIPPWVDYKLDLNCLKELPALEEFYFGMKDPIINKAWVKKKLQFFEICSRPSVKLDNLKSFYYHGNFKNETLYTLGRMATQLETVEVVLDEENCIVVQKSWPRLKNLKLLEGSDVPEELLSSLKSKRSLQSLQCL